jgi:hypothetical protein
MKEPIKAGDLCHIVGGVDGVNVGKTVRVFSLQGEHSQYGRIWRCKTEGDLLITQYGAVGPVADFAQSWLLKIDPVETNTKQTEKELEQ